jgi:hypothetical protein
MARHFFPGELIVRPAIDKHWIILVKPFVIPAIIALLLSVAFDLLEDGALESGSAQSSRDHRRSGPRPKEPYGACRHRSVGEVDERRDPRDATGPLRRPTWKAVGGSC